MKGFKIGAIAAALVLVIAVAGCGGGDDSSSSSTAAALSKEEFLAQGNQICAAGNKEIDAASKQLSSGKPSQDDLDAFVTGTLIPSVQSQIDGIRALGAPEGDEDQVNAILDSAQSAVDAGKADPSTLVGGDDPFAETNKLANEYGLTECGGS